MARPLKEINWDLVKKKMEAGCTAKEIFNSHDCKMSHDTFYERFKQEFGCSFQDYSTASSETGIGDIKLILHAKAMQGSLPAILFLAKCRAGMREPEIANLQAANQQQIDQSHRIMELEHKLAQYESNANKPQAE